MAVTTTQGEALEAFANGSNSPYLRFDADGTPIIGVWLGYEWEEDNFNPGQKRPVYLIEVNQEKKMLSSSSRRLAQAVLKANPKTGDFIKVTRVGEGFDTNYEVEISEIPFEIPF